MAKVIQGSPDSRVRRNGESPVVKASVEMEEQMVNLEGRSVTRSSDRIAKSLTDSSGPGHSSMKELLPPGRGSAGVAQQCPVGK